MENKIYIAAVVMGIVALTVLWLPSLWFMHGTVMKENTYSDYTKRNILKTMRDKCSDGDITWVLYHLKETDHRPNMNRSETENKILEIQKQQTSQWEFGSDNDRSISPTINKICKQNFDRVSDELESNCTIQELHTIFNYISADQKDQTSISKIESVEDIVAVQRTRLELNVTRWIDKICIERRLDALAMELMASCSGSRIKKLFEKLIYKKSGYDVCDQCVEKSAFIEAVIEVKRRYFHQVNLEPLIKKFCIEPELKTLKQKLTVNCSGVNVKDILNELINEITCDHCVEKADFIEAVINVKRLKFYEINLNPLILKYCSETSDD